MAQITISFGKGGAPSNAGGVSQVFDAYAQTEEVTSSGTSAATTITANKHDVARVTNHDASQMVWVTFGASPTAAVGTTHAIAPGSTQDLGPIGEGHKAAVIDDS